MKKPLAQNEKEEAFLLECFDCLRDIWNRRYLHGKDDGEKAIVKERVRKLFKVKNSAFV